MAKTTFLAIDPAGNVHTRKSAHGYTHAVLVRNSKEHALNHANVVSYSWNLKHAQEQFRFAAMTVEQHIARLVARNLRLIATPEYALETIAKAQALVAEFGTPEAYAEHHRAIDVAKVEAKDFTLWHVASFNSRRDLADKEQSKQRGHGWIAEAIIVNAMAR